MSGSFSQQLEDLLNPQPKFIDPEDDGDEETKAKVIEKFDEDEEEEDDGHESVEPSALRKHAASLLSDTDRRYAGKAVSRKQLLEDSEKEEEEEGGGGDDNDEEEEEEEGEGEDDDDDEEEEESEGEEELQESDKDDDLNDDGDDLKDSGVTFPKAVDFRKLTEGMDDLGVSEEEDDEEEDEEDEEESEGEEGESSVEDDSEQDDYDDSTVQTFSKDKVNEEVEKGQAVKNQLALWDQLLEGRIKFQKALVSANQLPQPPTFPEFKKNADFAGALKNSHKALKALQRSLLELQDELLVQSEDTRAISLGEQSDEEIISDEDCTVKQKSKKPQKRKLEMSEYADVMAKRFAAFTPYQNATLQKWHDKTRLTMGKTSKAFGAFDRNVLTQIEQVLMDKDRLIKRTQTRRSEYKVMGKKEGALISESATVEGEEPEKELKTNSHLKDLDEDIFDDDDFYHQLLRELIERKTNAADPNDQVAMGRQWLAIQKLRSKIKKKVDTKASKGRKVRFHIHSKLVSFMAPMDHSVMTDEAKSELYRGLFGPNSTTRE